MSVFNVCSGKAANATCSIQQKQEVPLTTEDRFSHFSCHFYFLCKTQSLIHTVLSNSESSSKPPKQIFFFSLVGPLKECCINKHLWLCCRKELMARLSGGGGRGGTSQGALGESCSTWTLRVTSQQRRKSHLVSYVEKQREPHRALWGCGVPARTAAESAGTVLGDQVSCTVQRRER